ncbi:hypothetical protein DSL72_003449 [Monilinia vaccinii-corymbosi]|uniref:Uncharacterized protein n=1 Tax=Monilinia vaccinii-corymbosi TaxID=61207 RepID=A0A8A3NWV4_9HELO|nr:hypothetical protein DSL72_003449 [Monilinia vaccinii-corymbosi]
METMEREDDHPKAKLITLQIDNVNEFPALSSIPSPPTQKPVIASTWSSLFASQVPKAPRPVHHPSISPLSITPTTEISLDSNSTEENENMLISPSAAECMSILSYETTETAVERDEANTPWDSPTAEKDLNISVAKDENIDSDATIIFPGFIATDIDTPEPPQKELLPPFEFPAMRVEAEMGLYNTSPKLTKAEKMEVEELSEAERHDTPSYIRGGLPLRQVVENDPDRVLHAIRHMMNGIVQMRRQLGAPPDEIKFLIKNHQRALNQIDFLSENERVARLAVERREAANREARLATEKKRAIYAREVESSKSTKFNPSAKSFSPSTSNSMPMESIGSTPSFALPFPPKIQKPSPLKYSVLQEPGFMVEQRRTSPAPYKFHPLLNRSRTWSTHRPSIAIGPAGPYSHFNTCNIRPRSPIFVHQVQLPFSKVPSQLPLDSLTHREVDPQQETIVQTPPRSPTTIQSQLHLSLADMSLLRTPVTGKTDHKSTPTSPTKELSADPSFKATSTNTSPRRKKSNFHRTCHQPQLPQSKAHCFKMIIPPIDTADDIQRAVFLIPRTHRHICPSSLTSPDFKCHVPGCLLQEICPDFTSENGCPFRPHPLSDWPWIYPHTNPSISQDRQCQFVHIPGTCIQSLSHHHTTKPSSEATLAPYPDQDPATQSHYCPIPRCSIMRVHPWGCAKDWKTGLAANGYQAIPPDYEVQTHHHHHHHHHQAAGEIPAEWRWRTAMEGLRIAHARGDYGCRGGSMPAGATFPAGHPGADLRNWGPSSSFLPTHTHVRSRNGRACGKDRDSDKDKERGRLRGGGDGSAGSRGGGSGSGSGSRAGSHDPRGKPTRTSSA